MTEDDIKESILSEDICDICNGELKNIAVIKKCFHFFCLPCLQQYSDVTNKCPTCSKEYTYFLSNITGDLKGKVNRVKTFDECSICMDGFRNKAKLDACDHEYCFQCIKNWSNVQNACPACRQPFSTIFYNFRSEHDYDVHLVALQNEESSDEVDEQNERFEDHPDEHGYPHRSQISETARATLPTARDIAPSIVTNFNPTNFGGFDLEFHTIGFPVYGAGIDAPLLGVLPPAYDQNTRFTDVQFKPAVESRINSSSAINNTLHSANHGFWTSSAFGLNGVSSAPENLSTNNNNTAHSANRGFHFGSRLDPSDAHNPFQSIRSMTSSGFGLNGFSPAPVNPSSNNNTVHSANRGFQFGSRLDSNDAHDPFQSTRSMTSSGYRHEYSNQSFYPATANSSAEAVDGSRSTVIQVSTEQLTHGTMNSAHKIPSLNPQDVIGKPLLTNNSLFPNFSDYTLKIVPAPTLQSHLQANLPSDIAQPLPPSQGLVARLPRRSHLDPSFHPYNFSHSFQNTGNHDS